MRIIGLPILEPVPAMVVVVVVVVAEIVGLGQNAATLGVETRRLVSRRPARHLRRPFHAAAVSVVERRPFGVCLLRRLRLRRLLLLLLLARGRRRGGGCKGRKGGRAKGRR
jgi:hypothetical protein